ncbi:hypothetical protein [Evtepia sp.]|uniref:hypothetical protein n=1 Tax=Evtepia sp. TaxID=2773933 RepID=UPI002A833369|nr:hypothetical protein [Evtepia sp.]MDY4429678.1 hypothetical protein [Evtepia sp.]
MMKKLRDFTQGDKLNALKTALVVVLLLGIAGSGFLGYSLYDSREENTLLADQMNVQAASMAAEIDDLNSTISRLESSGGDKDSRIQELEAEVETLEEQVETLEAQLAEKSSSSASQSTGSSSGQTVSQSSGSASSSGSSSSSSETQSQTVYITRTGSKYHRNGCQYLRQSQIAISLSDAKARGYTACSRCF